MSEPFPRGRVIFPEYNDEVAIFQQRPTAHLFAVVGDALYSRSTVSFLHRSTTEPNPFVIYLHCRSAILARLSIAFAAGSRSYRFVFIHPHPIPLPLKGEGKSKKRTLSPPYLTSFDICLNSSVPARSRSWNRNASVVPMTAPALSISSIPFSQSSSFLDTTASAGT